METNVQTKQVFAYIFKMVKPFYFPVLIMIWVAIAWSINLSLTPYLLKIILNELASGIHTHVFGALAVPTIFYLGSNFVMTTSYRLYNYFVEIRMIPQLRANIANYSLGLLLDKSHSYYQKKFSGSLANKVNDLVNSIPEVIRIIFDSFFSNAVALSIAIFTLWHVNERFAWLMIGWTTLFFAVTFFYVKHLTVLAVSLSEINSTITGKLVDAFSNILSVRLFATKKHEKINLNTTLNSAVLAERKVQWTYLCVWLFYGYSFFILQVFNFYFLCKGIESRWVSVGDFALVLGINSSIVSFLWQLAEQFSRFAKYFGRTTQALNTILSPIDVTDKLNATSIKVNQGRIVFDKVKFSYKENYPLFDGQSLIIEAGQKVGLVGYSGGGKTTLVNLILRLYNIADGRILIDGQNITDVTQDSLRRKIAMIPQDPSLFHRSIMENIRYGRIDASDEEVIDAAKKAHAHDFIMKLPHCYDSLVGERGVKLSGGQRQRIAIARAILKQAPILILDEATSQLDSMTEQNIQASLWELMQGKTALVIAHRLSTLLQMDRILVFDHGHIVEDGTHQQLLEQGGLYKMLWDAQIGGFLLDKENDMDKEDEIDEEEK